MSGAASEPGLTFKAPYMLSQLVTSFPCFQSKRSKYLVTIRFHLSFSISLGWVNHRLCLVKAQPISSDLGSNTYHLEKTDLDQTR